MHEDYRIADDNIVILRQGLDLLGQISDDAYRAQPMGQSAVGVHVRHFLNFYENFLHGLGTGMIDYDHRKRDREVEGVRAVALDRLAMLIGTFEIAPMDGLRELLVRQDTLLPANDPRAWAQSTVHRELQCLIGHTIHHYALIALTLRIQGIATAPTFGYAPSTVEYLHGQGMRG